MTEEELIWVTKDILGNYVMIDDKKCLVGQEDAIIANIQ